MDRRTTLATLLGKKSVQVSPPPMPEDTTLQPYAGDWGFEQAAHLLRRAMFSPTYQQIKDAADQGLDATIAQLFQTLPLPEPPVNYYFREDPYVPIGETWIDAPYLRDVNTRTPRFRSLRAWTMGLLLTEGISVREKLTLFWHNHFSTNNVNDPKYLYRYITLLRENALGNFRELVKKVTIDPTMLRFLNGNQNRNGAPNENYARELMELFTLGKGDQVGPGDYSTYTEQDVAELARALTGWVDRGFNAIDPAVTIDVFFLENRHDKTPKQLSHRFNNLVISDMGDQEYAHVVDVIFEKPEVARFISRKLYRWFVYYKIDESVETNIIQPMADMLIANDFEIQPILEALLRSEHFFNVLSVGPMIKNPIDFIVSAVKTFELDFGENLTNRYEAWYQLFRQTPLMQMEYYQPPEVAGWKAYYQEPLFYRTWINASTLPRRMNLTDTLAINGFRINGEQMSLDVFKFIKTIDDPYDPNNVIAEFAKILMPQPLTENQMTLLKEIILPGLPDHVWGTEYVNYEENPNDMQLAGIIETKLRNLIKTMMNMPEFYLS